MIIAATMLATDQADLVYEATRSVLDWADLLIVIAEHHYPVTLAEAYRASIDAGKQGCVRYFQYTWDDDFAAARNFALDCARRCQADWAVTIDCDERIRLNGLTPEEMRLGLQAALVTDSDTLMVTAQDGDYAKDRLFRLPARGRWTGAVHECYVNFGVRTTLPTLTFAETVKSPEEYRAKLERDARALERMTRDEPGNGRWWYYLGFTYEMQGNQDGAYDCYDRCYQGSAWAEERAWAAYKKAAILHAQQRYGLAATAAIEGLEELPTPENAWMAGLCMFYEGRYLDATEWAQFAIILAGTGRKRDSFIYRPAHFEGPWNVLRFAYRTLHRDVEADQAEEMYALRLAERSGLVLLAG